MIQRSALGLALGLLGLLLAAPTAAQEQGAPARPPRLPRQDRAQRGRRADLRCPERCVGSAHRGPAREDCVRRQRRDLGRPRLWRRGWLGIDGTAMERAGLPERERRSEDVPEDYRAYLHFIKEKGAEIYYNATMALLYQIDPERIDDALEPLALQPLLQVLTADADYLVY